MEHSTTYVAKGLLFFRYDEDDETAGLGIRIVSIDDLVERVLDNGHDKEQEAEIRDFYTEQFTNESYDIIDGEEFIDSVLEGRFTDYDGFIETIYVDGYESNLGIACDYLTCGKFLVSERAFKEICKSHKVEVDWVNK